MARKRVESLGQSFDSGQIREATQWALAEEALYARLHTFMEERTALHSKKEALTEKMAVLKEQISKKNQAVEMGTRELETLADRARELQLEQVRTGNDIQALESDLAHRIGDLGKIPPPGEEGKWLRHMSGLRDQYQDAVRSKEMSEQKLVEIRQKRGLADKELVLAKESIEELSGKIGEKESQRTSRVWERRSLFGERIPGTERKRLAADAAAAEKKIRMAVEERDLVAGQINGLKGERRSMGQRLDTLGRRTGNGGPAMG